MAEGMDSSSASEQAAASLLTKPESAVTASDKPTCIVCLGMAGSGKTTFMQRISTHLYSKKCPPYCINLDPAVNQVPFPANIDIRDTVKYKEIMKQYGLGPNGAIVTSLNLFSTRFDQVIGLIDKKGTDCKYILLDTPGQIEVFTWSASGSIITETLASTYPTVIVYIMDIVRSVNPVTFMSNMLYACSILYKIKLPFVVVMNKTDIVDHTFAMEWMQDFEVFHEALQQETSYASGLARSMSLVLDEFYQNLKAVGVSSLLGTGIEEFFQAVADGVKEYHSVYYPQLLKAKQSQAKDNEEKQKAELEKLRKDFGAANLLDIAPNIVAKDPERPVETATNRVFVNLGAADEEDSDDAMEDDTNDKLEEESFQKFLKSSTSTEVKRTQS
ncbi:GPN-loop GTPase 1-like [Dysidea avara]|uniref:GPN-loop GTPase 1-like n=1 Tax=Dysidea avara TaxID=196820 RepID=UPI00331BAA08